MRLLIFALAVLYASECWAQPPAPADSIQTKAEGDLEGLVWNKWDADSFVVISLDESRGKSLTREAESIRRAALSRWGLPPQRTSPCKLVLVPDAPMLRRLFGLSDPRCEVRVSGTSPPDSAIWIDDDRISLLPSLMLECELAAGNFKPFARRGVPVLERPAAHVRSELLASADYPLSKVLSPPKEPSDAVELARNSALACLLVRREFGAKAFFYAARGDSPEIHESLGFASAQDLERTYGRYRKNLIDDLKNGRTPDEYLAPKR